jgi:hypothetical protein
LGTGAIAGIVSGVVSAVVAVLGLAFKCYQWYREKEKKEREKPSPVTASEEATGGGG